MPGVVVEWNPCRAVITSHLFLTSSSSSSFRSYTLRASATSRSFWAMYASRSACFSISVRGPCGRFGGGSEDGVGRDVGRGARFDRAESRLDLMPSSNAGSSTRSRLDDLRPLACGVLLGPAPEFLYPSRTVGVRAYFVEASRTDAARVRGTTRSRDVGVVGVSAVFDGVLKEPRVGLANDGLSSIASLTLTSKGLSFYGTNQHTSPDP